MSIVSRFQNAWNVFNGRDPTFSYPGQYYTDSARPDRIRINLDEMKGIVSSVYNQIAVDCERLTVQHVILNEEKRYEKTVYDSLNYCLNGEANIDQTGRELIRDIVISMLDEGVVAVVPIRTNKSIYSNKYFTIYELKVGKIIDWTPRQVKVHIYNEDDGEFVDIVVDKQVVAIIENPFYTIMNEQNSTAKRLSRVLSKLDIINSEINPSRLDLIIQVPYGTSTKVMKERAKQRRSSLEEQLKGSKLGIGYIDGTEKVVQLNRGLENNLWEQAKDLQEQLFNQLGFSKTIFDGTATEETMLNYHNRTIEPIMSTITQNMDRKWISPTARALGHAIVFFTEPFKSVPVSKFAELTDKLTRNEVMTSNEIRSTIGLKPSSDPKADELRNSNISHPNEEKETEIIKEIQNE